MIAAYTKNQEATVRMPTLVVLLALCLPSVALATDIVAHRGASHDAPENTVASARLAWEQGADSLEFDVHLTLDGHIVVIHDHDAHRTTGLKREIADLTLAQLRELDAGSWKDSRFAGERIPTLEEMLATVPEGGRVVVEIKCGPPVVEKLEEAFVASGLRRDQLVVIGFDRDIVGLFKRRNPDIETVWLKKIRRHLITRRWTPGVDEIVRSALEAGVDGIDVKAAPTVDAAFVRAVRRAGLRLYVYTVDDPARAAELIRLGVDGITTNRPGLMRDVRARTE